MYKRQIEDSLHPLLTRRLIEMVQDKAVNTKGAQLIFTTHDAMPVSYTHLDVYKRQEHHRTQSDKFDKIHCYKST